MSHTVRVRCICPDPATHPDGDDINLPEKLSFHQLAYAVKTVRLAKSIDPRMSFADSLAVLEEAYLRKCLDSWTLKNGKAIPLNEENVETYLLSQPEVALEVAERADELFSEVVMAPLVKAAQRSSPPSPTDELTSPPKAPGASRKRSRRSSTTTTPTAVTAPTA